jgi:hypothetical protein
MQESTAPPSAISNAELTDLALKSAIELDRRLARREAGNIVVPRLLDVLGRMVNITPDQTTGKLLSDPRRVGIVSRAFRHSNREAISTVQDLIAKINLLSNNYNNAAAPDDEITRLRDFCLALHKELLARAYRGYADDRKREGATQNATRLF